MKAAIGAVLLALGCVGTAFAATPVPDGRWRFMFKDAKGRPDRPIEVYTYRPRRCDSRCPITFILPGPKRDASLYLQTWELVADKYRMILVVPSFGEREWPKAAAYNLGDVAGQPDREKWAFSAIEHLFDEVRDGQNGYAIFGISAGGQFVQRMALFRPDSRATVMGAANPGWYTMPEWRKEKVQDPFPYSLVGSAAGDAQLRQALAKRFVLVVSSKDENPDDEGSNDSAGAKRQGETRIDRAEGFFKVATTAANDLGVKLAWDLVEAPESAREGEQLARAAARAMFGN